LVIQFCNEIGDTFFVAFVRVLSVWAQHLIFWPLWISGLYFF
jgi:hypothetical protein